MRFSRRSLWATLWAHGSECAFQTRFPAFLRSFVSKKNERNFLVLISIGIPPQYFEFEQKVAFYFSLFINYYNYVLFIILIMI